MALLTVIGQVPSPLAGLVAPIPLVATYSYVNPLSRSCSAIFSAKKFAARILFAASLIIGSVVRSAAVAGAANLTARFVLFQCVSVRAPSRE